MPKSMNSPKFRGKVLREYILSIVSNKKKVRHNWYTIKCTLCKGHKKV